jgi:hypothetical protein
MVPRNRRAVPAALDATPPRRSRRLHTALACSLAAACLGVPLAGSAVAAPASQSTTTTAVAPAVNHAVPAAQLQINMLTQDQDQWCWVASGLTIAQFLGKGKDIDENTFCAYARGLEQGAQCPNEAGELSYDQTAFSKLGMSNPGEVGGNLPFDQVKSQIDGGKPIETGIMWTAGGGHAEVIYGYNDNTLMYGDPWPANQRYGEMAYDQYVSNDQFSWQQALYGMG